MSLERAYDGVNRKRVWEVMKFFIEILNMIAIINFAIINLVD